MFVILGTGGKRFLGQIRPEPTGNECQFLPLYLTGLAGLLGNYILGLNFPDRKPAVRDRGKSPVAGSA